ncbi:MAG: N-acetylmuramoyl-L-alanine amidase [Lactobacillus sp.]|uniref:N-acetylmuramoyl-L-alanine amidase n=1 Tax=Bombilactobacillus bombi TaxID=1303590 RepID=A0A3R6YNR5_9LACO|nr:peptidoglycan recognition family protein [Bombilactobacillus bombi]MCO6542563.1 N-acetylmuramoyl-L-alanine amidase [Lactobacillus sp.]RHW52004.1 N-acetylmuramoyl-L-alanine amidase [Bombilactobacillus bombi]
MSKARQVPKLLQIVVAFAAFLLSLSGAHNVHAETINEYIEQNNIQPNEIHRVNGTFDQMFGYRNGVGRPEGVVIHETATPGASAWNEVTYFNREWRNAQTYVHAFADANNILQIHDTDYGVWGAGPWANSRMIQIELCEENTRANFARSVNNQAYFTAVMLKRYGLTPSLADGNGSGTIWSHNAINQYHPSAGGHTDPIGYFNKWGYTMWQFYELVQYHFNRLNGSAPVNNGTTNNATNSNSDKTGTVRINSNIRNNLTLLSSRQDDGSMTIIGDRALPSASNWKIDKVATYAGQTYYRVSTNEWVLASECTVTKYIPE